MKINQALDLDEAGLQERGARARERLLQEAMRIFADKGFAKASTREICQAAGTNVASIHYYFGDKAGLYRAVLLCPIEALTSEFANFDDPALSLEEALRCLMAAFLSPVGHGEGDEHAEHGMRLHLREMVEPSATYKELIAQHIQPHHQRVVGLLAKHVGVPGADDDALHQLAFALLAMVQDYCLSREFMKVLAPALLDGEAAVRKVLDRLVGYGVALVAHERAMRAVATD
ncbi:CerR family C-terminal domain-containing protein [Aquabacterium sp.]|uniref:CerR family C-terminal domain-containing protein n=1 Tax=Aquabacterium sp. TaxID=1872578 RepID=UPI003D6CDA44